MAHMCLVKEAIVPEGCAGTLRTPLSPSGGLMSSELLTGFMGELSCRERSTALSGEPGCAGLSQLRSRAASDTGQEGQAGWHFKKGTSF